MDVSHRIAYEISSRLPGKSASMPSCCDITSAVSSPAAP